MSQTFDFSRMMIYAKLKFSLNLRLLLISILGYFGLIFIISFFVSYHSIANSVQVLGGLHMGALAFMIICGAIILAGRSFQDMNTSEKSIGQILIPASISEKFIVPLLFSSIGWFIISILSYEIFAFVVNLLWSALFDMQFSFFNVFNFQIDKEFFELLWPYFLLHSIFFLGSAAFKKYPIAKTLLANFIINNAYTVLSMILIIVFYGSFKSFGRAAENLGEIIIENGWFNEENLKYWILWFKIFVFGVLPFLLYVTAYFKLKEREV